MNDLQQLKEQFTDNALEILQIEPHAKYRSIAPVIQIPLHREGLIIASSLNSKSIYFSSTAYDKNGNAITPIAVLATQTNSGEFRYEPVNHPDLQKLQQEGKVCYTEASEPVQTGSIYYIKREDI